MKKSKIISIIGLFFIVFYLVNTAHSQEIKIGAQIWADKNLDVSTFRNGDTIVEARSNEDWARLGKEKKPAWCYYQNDIANGKKYGKMYNWFAVNDPRGLAPKGWHVPSDAEWIKLIEVLGGEVGVGLKMKSTDGWEIDGNGTNSSNFSALPGGIRDMGGIFIFIGQSGYWWSKTEYQDEFAWSRSLFYKNNDLVKFARAKKKESGISVRCIKD